MSDFLSGLGEWLQTVGRLSPALLEGLQQTLKLFGLTLVLAIPLGLPFALGSNSRFAPFRWLSKLYIWVFRGTPLMLQLFFFYFGLPILLQSFGIGMRLDRFPTTVITFVLNYAAYFAEIYRAGIESIDRGQYEAAQSLGLGRTRTMFGIILPQTAKRVLPPVFNETITLVKDTALAQVIGVSELLKAAAGAMNRDQDVTAYILAALLYLLLTFFLTLLSRLLEKRFSRYEAKEA